MGLIARCPSCGRKLRRTEGATWWDNHARDCPRRGMPPARGSNQTYIETCDVCEERYIAHQRGSHYCSKRCNMLAVQVLGRRVRPRHAVGGQ